MVRFSVSLMIMERRSTPIMTLSFAYSKSGISTIFLFCRAARRAASLTRLARSAPEKPGRTAGQQLQLHVGGQRNASGVDAKNLLAALDVGTRHHHLAIEATGTEQSGIEHVGPVGGGDEDDPLVRLEAVHLHQELVEGLLAFVVAAAEPGATVAAHGIDLVHEDDAGRVLLALFEQIAHARGAHPDEHLHEVGAGDGEEGHVGLAGDGLGQQGLSRARWSHQEDPLGDLAPELLELLRDPSGNR